MVTRSKLYKLGMLTHLFLKNFIVLLVEIALKRLTTLLSVLKMRVQIIVQVLRKPLKGGACFILWEVTNCPRAFAKAT